MITSPPNTSTEQVSAVWGAGRRPADVADIDPGHVVGRRGGKMVDDDSSDEVLSISSRQEGDRAVVEIEGELDDAGAGRLAAEVQSMLAGRVEVLEIDAGGLTFVDSAGLRALVLARAAAEDAGTNFRISAISEPIARVMEISGLSEVLLAAEPKPR
jgi:anti-anti-sigma factor